MDKTVLIGVGVVAVVGLAVVLLTRNNTPSQTITAAPEPTAADIRAGLPPRGDNPGDTVAGIGEGIGSLLRGVGDVVVRVGERDAARAREERLAREAAEDRADRRDERALERERLTTTRGTATRGAEARG